MGAKLGRRFLKQPAEKLKAVFVACSLHLSHKDIKTLQLNVQNKLDKVDTWMRSNRLSINYNKTAYMILTTSSKTGLINR